MRNWMQNLHRIPVDDAYRMPPGLERIGSDGL